MRSATTMRVAITSLVFALGCLRERSAVTPRARVVTPVATPARPDAAATPDASSTVVPDAPPEPRAYADPPAVAALARDPAWRMPIDPLVEEGWACSSSVHPQSCEPDPCFEGVGQQCRDRCGAQCDSSERGCRSDAVTCRGRCADDGCRVR